VKALPRRTRWLGIFAMALTVVTSNVVSRADVRSDAGATPPTLRVRAFFSGHSLLDNPLPNWIEAMARGRGDSLGWQQQIVLGSPIRLRTRGEDANGSGFDGYRLGRSRAGGPIDVLGELERPVQLAPGEKYDRLVIAERPDLLGTMQWEGTIDYLHDFHQRVARQNPDAQTLLYEVWPEIDRSDPAAWVRYVQQELFAWECVAARVNDALVAAGGRDGVRVVPAGLALSRLVQRAIDGDIPGVEGPVAKRLDAIFKDDLHLTPMAVYLMASVHYGALFEKSPLGAVGADSVEAALLPMLQSLAWGTLVEYRAGARPAPTLAECSARIAAEVCPAYHRIHGRASRAESCELWTKPDSPLAGGPPPPMRGWAARWGAAAVFVVLATLLLAALWYRSAHSRRRALG